MKIKRFLMLLLLSIAVLSLAGCAAKAAKPEKGGSAENDGTTEYDNKQVVKIETKINGGYTFDGASYNRTFDFESNTVTDEVEVYDKDMTIKCMLYLYENGYCNDEYESVDEYGAYLQTYYNSLKQIEAFSPEQGVDLLKNLKLSGIYTWEEKYENHYVDDLNWYNVIITFADGTVKTSSFYCDYPDNFEQVKNTFSEYLSVGLWYDFKR